MNFPLQPSGTDFKPIRLPNSPATAVQNLHFYQVQQQQQTVPYHQQLHMNGLNGGQVPGAMAGFPTPAGHSAELNYIHAMVEELSRQLAENKRVLEDVVMSAGRVRSRARAQQQGNEEIISAAGDELILQEANMDALVSLLTESLEKAKYSRDANAVLLSQFATTMRSMLDQFHEYKGRHVADVSAWHHSYRAQLAEAREENSRLREQMWAMQEHAGAANAALRTFRGRYEEDEERWQRRVDARAHRQELRFWKRLAMPELPDDDPYWSDDDDLVDEAEKVRLRDLAKAQAQEQLAGIGAAAGQQQQQRQLEGGEGEEGEPVQQPEPLSMLGGVAMARDDGGISMPILPPRPSSAASTGSSGQ